MEILAHENRTAFDALAARIRAEFQPQGEHEAFLINQMIDARWRLVRLNRLEAAAFDQICGTLAADTPDAKIIAHLSQKGRDVLGILQRQSAAAERSYHKNHRELLHGRKLDQNFQTKAMDDFIKNKVFGGTTAPAPKPNGFASQIIPLAQTLGNLALRL